MSTVETESQREVLDRETLRRQREAGVVIIDGGRRRPLWFDGRFLDAEALRGEQNYFLARQADLGRVVGSGVISGLEVELEGPGARRLRIESGQGLTPSGRPVVIAEPVILDLGDIATAQTLDLGFGLTSRPRQPPFNRTGLYVLALRPVEYTAQPVSAYPAGVEGERVLRDGAVVEATAITLIPYAAGGAWDDDVQRRRQRIAREIFLAGERRGQPEEVLPLALLELEQGLVRWLDLYLVRREIGSRERDWGLGQTSRALNVAHLRHYIDVLESLEQTPAIGRIVATEQFEILPPVGPLPQAAVEPGSLKHGFFPPGIAVDLAVIAEDELPAVVEDSLLLPPLDLSLDEGGLAGMAVQVMIPLSRQRLAVYLPRLGASTRPLGGREDDNDALWRELLGGAQRLWYRRHRNLAHGAEPVSQRLAMEADEEALMTQANAVVAAAGLSKDFKRLLNRASPGGVLALYRLMADLADGSPLLPRAVLAELRSHERIDAAVVAQVAAGYGEGFGEGLARVEALARGKWLKQAADEGLLRALDRAGQTLDEPRLEDMLEKLAETLAAGDIEGARMVLKEAMR